MDHRLKCKTKNYKTFRENRKKSLGCRARKRVLKLDLTSQFIKEKNDKLDFIKIKNLCSEKNPVKRVRRQARLEENICIPYIHMSRIHKDFSKLRSRKVHNLIRK